jgi:hypothetical protein
MGFENKKIESQNTKLQESFRKLQDKKTNFGMCINQFDMTQKVANGKSLYKYIPESEYWEMVKIGYEDNHKELVKENEQLKHLLLLLQEELSSVVEKTIKEMKNCNEKDDELFKSIGYNRFILFEVDPEFL